MGDVSAYSTTAASNSTIDGINVAEGCNASGINDAIRAFMADIRNSFNDAAWFQYGVGTGSPAPVYVSATSFKQPGVNVTTAYHAGRRVKAVGATTGTIYGTIASSAFGADTTVTVVWDTGSLANESITVYLSQIPVTGRPVPAPDILLSSFNGTNLSSSYAQLAAVTLTPGQWRLSASVTVIASVSATYMNGAISTTTASSAGTTLGLTSIGAPINSVSVGLLVFPAVDITVTSATTYYFNVDGNGTGVAALAGFLRAERVQ